MAKSKQQIEEDKAAAFVAALRLTDARRRYYRHKGFDLEQLQMMIEAFEGECAICGSWMPRHPNGWQVDHDHESSPPHEARGILCGPCNSGLGLFGDDPTILRRAAQYLDYSYRTYRNKRGQGWRRQRFMLR